MTEKETYWSQFSKTYHDANNYVVGKKNLNIFYKRISEFKNLGNTLEIGCGIGNYSSIIIKESRKLTATDLSDEMLSEAKKNLSIFKNIKVEKANCYKTPYQDKSFDTIFMANLLHIVDSPEKAIAEANRVLKDNGSIIIITFTSYKMSFINTLKMMYRYIKTYGKPSPYAKKMTLNDVEKLLSKHNFKIQDKEVIGETMNSIIVKASK